MWDVGRAESTGCVNSGRRWHRRIPSQVNPISRGHSCLWPMIRGSWHRHVETQTCQTPHASTRNRRAGRPAVGMRVDHVASTVAGDQIQPRPLPRPDGGDRRRRHELVGRSARSVQALQSGRRDGRSDGRVAGRPHADEGRARARERPRERLATFGGSRSASTSRKPTSTSGGNPDDAPPSCRRSAARRRAIRRRPERSPRRSSPPAARASAPTTSSSRADVNSWPCSFIASDTPSVQNTKTSPACSENVDLVVASIPRTIRAARPATRSARTRSAEHRIGYGRPEFAIVIVRRFRSKMA